ncbi:dimethylsulfonioproprionate lyase family protein [Paracoccus sp. P2]|uniref:dimethylsulfonioproprionate lyase family protein n=1 Tax=Paracoccus sp. P2 TaxID=3248840 RepID=UPI00391F753C
MSNRNAALQTLLDNLEASIAASGVPEEIRGDLDSAFRGLEQPTPSSPSHAPFQVEACKYLPHALEISTQTDIETVRSVAVAFKEIAPALFWTRRKGTENTGDFFKGHANAILIGPGGLEERDDIWLGVSLMAPQIVYPVHTHPPEEMYLVMSDGDWFQHGEGWVTPGIGGTVYNPGGIEHTMRAKSDPLLAFWLLWGGRH